MLPNILQDTEQLSTTKNELVPDADCAEIEKFHFKPQDPLGFRVTCSIAKVLKPAQTQRGNLLTKIT